MPRQSASLRGAGPKVFTTGVESAAVLATGSGRKKANSLLFDQHNEQIDFKDMLFALNTPKSKR